MANIILFNTLGREKQKFIPLKKGRVSLYTCGPTAYWYAHIGNMRSYIFEDILRRTLEYNKLKVKHVMNVTDVGHLTSDGDEGEDKMVKALRREGKPLTLSSVKQVAKFYEKAFFRDVKKLNILMPGKIIQATRCVHDMIKFIEKIEARGYTYKTSVGLTFDTSKYEHYAELGKLNLEEQREGARGKKDSERRNASDFALWITNQPKHIMQWDSPWGRGFPGWHLECAVIATCELGEKIDIHCGGVDHIQVHHTNERAEAEAVTGERWVNFWMHNEFLLLNNGKMAKSDGKIITVEALEKRGYDPLVLRYFFLTAHYRSQQDFTWAGLSAAKTTFERLKNLVLELKAKKDSNGKIDSYQKEFLENVNDDLNMPEALAVVWNVLRSELGSKQKLALLLDFDKVLGLGLKSVKKDKVPKEISVLVKKREAARAKKDWKTSDKIRAELAKKGWLIEDKATGAKVKKA